MKPACVWSGHRRRVWLLSSACDAGCLQKQFIVFFLTECSDYFIFAFTVLYTVGYLLKSSELLTFSGYLLLLWSPKVYYSMHRSQPLCSILKQFYPVHTFTLYVCKICFNIILQCMHISHREALPLGVFRLKVSILYRLTHVCYRSGGWL